MRSQRVGDGTPHDYNKGNEIAPSTYERKTKITWKPIIQWKSYSMLLICFLFISAILTTNNVQVNKCVTDKSMMTNNLSVEMHEQQTLKLPNILLIGAQKAGTTALADTLFNRFGVCRSQMLEAEPPLVTGTKEVHFFDYTERFQQGLEFYSKKFQHCAGKPLAMDATPNYILPYNATGQTENNTIPEKVRIAYDSTGQTGNLKILVILREPGSRELSAYNHMCRSYLKGIRNHWVNQIAKENGVIMNFTEFVMNTTLPEMKRGRGQGLYSQHLKKWFSNFDRKQILVLSYDELLQDESTHIERVAKFLDLEDGTDESIHTKKKNAGVGKRKVSMPECPAQRLLASAFAESNEELYTLLEAQPGPDMEQRPFPRFQLGDCSPDGDSQVQ